jgi:hypothetical protein
VRLLLVLIDELADSRDGVLTLEEALRSGLTLRQVQHRIRRGQWSKLYPGVYLVGRYEPDQGSSTRPAVTWAGSAAVASGLTGVVVATARLGASGRRGDRAPDAISSLPGERGVAPPEPRPGGSGGVARIAGDRIAAHRP